MVFFDNDNQNAARRWLSTELSLSEKIKKPLVNHF